MRLLMKSRLGETMLTLEPGVTEWEFEDLGSVEYKITCYSRIE